MGTSKLKKSEVDQGSKTAHNITYVFAIQNPLPIATITMFGLQLVGRFHLECLVYTISAVTKAYCKIRSTDESI